MATPRKTRSQGPVEAIDLDHPNGKDEGLAVEKELGFYASYHSNKINKAIHFVCIPLLVWTALIMMSHVPLPGSQPIEVYRGFAFQPNLAVLVLSGYQVYYFLLEPFAALTFLPLAALMLLTATNVAVHPPADLPLLYTKHFKSPSSMPFAIALHVSSWIAQFIGHGVFERRAPALLTNLSQAFVLAPFFVHIEMLFGLFNYKPELHRKMINNAGKRIRDMNRAAKMK